MSPHFRVRMTAAGQTISFLAIGSSYPAAKPVKKGKTPGQQGYIEPPYGIEP
jgi:hypothetical protein